MKIDELGALAVAMNVQDILISKDMIPGIVS
jgi:hypothetical protein